MDKPTQVLDRLIRLDADIAWLLRELRGLRLMIVDLTPAETLELGRYEEVLKQVNAILQQETLSGIKRRAAQRTEERTNNREDRSDS